MPDARTHDKIAVVSGVVLAPLSGAALFMTGIAPQQAALDTAILVGSHLVCSYWLSPDLDIDSAIDDRWGPLRLLWWPYQRLVPHRHWISHSGVSALLRLLYLVLMLNAILFLAGFVLPEEAQRVVWGSIVFVREHPREMMLVLLGAVFSDIVHTMSDRISTRHKRRLRVRRVQKARHKSSVRRYRR